MEIINRKARHDYFIEDVYEAGIVLTGTEIKSVRSGNANIKDSYGIVRDHEIFLLNMFISQYKEGNIFNHNESRTRKLLLHKKEIRKLQKEVKENGLTVVPTKLYFNTSKLKVEIALARGKKLYDKRQDLKEKDSKRDIERALKNAY